MNTIEVIIISGLIVGLILLFTLIGLLRQLRWFFLPPPYYFPGTNPGTNYISTSREKGQENNGVIPTIIFIALLILWMAMMNNQNRDQGPAPPVQENTKIKYHEENAY